MSHLDAAYRGSTWGRFGWWWDGLAGWQRSLFVLAVCGGAVFAVLFPMWLLTALGLA
ncbi:hypothetical protein [Olsenella profusa]|uniref:Uncharacterized protein n=1 Tax=Olsenella profusa F0195 TaxID=1125712 RepID=U2VBG5_9ACTN|nr:hypothetical protein [Olsenella profusa]ERL09931.1 hypothetical protein HMPREF1316_2530 [Olsenella profusa F0195]